MNKQTKNKFAKYCHFYELTLAFIILHNLSNSVANMRFGNELNNGRYVIRSFVIKHRL